MKQLALFESNPVDQVIEVKDNVPLPNFRYVGTASELVPFVSKLKESSVLGLDTETTGLDPLSDRVRLLQLAAPGWPVLVLDLFSLKNLELVQHILDSPQIKIVQNAKFDLKFLTAAGLEVRGQIFDPMLAGQLLSCGAHHQRHSLEALVAGYLHQTLSKTERLSDWTASQLTQEQLLYAARDAAVLLPLREVLIERLKSAALIKTAKIEFDCVRAVTQMELSGIRLDVAKWHHLSQVMAQLKTDLAQKLQQIFGSGFLQEINLDSPTQVQQALAQKGLKLNNTSRWALSQHNEKEEIKLLLTYRKASKLCSSFLNVIPDFLHPKTHRLHPSYEQCGVVSGRFSCHSPNLQQLPREKEFRECFIPEEGNCLVIADYSQIELRVAAQYSQDQRMIEAYGQGQDLHSLTASLITHKSLDQVTKTDRQAAKAVNFGLLYGQGAKGLKDYARQSYGVEMSLEEAGIFRERFFQAYTGIAVWHQNVARNQKQITETRTLIGRRRLIEKSLELPGLLNTPIQGTAADITKLALAKLHSALAETGAKIIGCIHDEILVESPNESSTHVATLLMETMEAAGREIVNQVPVQAESRICRSWAEK